MAAEGGKLAQSLRPQRLGATRGKSLQMVPRQLTTLRGSCSWTEFAWDMNEKTWKLGQNNSEEASEERPEHVFSCPLQTSWPAECCRSLESVQAGLLRWYTSLVPKDAWKHDCAWVFS